MKGGEGNDFCFCLESSPEVLADVPRILVAISVYYEDKIWDTGKSEICSTLDGIRDAYKILVRRCELRWEHRRRWENDLKVDVIEVRCEVVKWIG
jgi:hypothetical protein